MSEFHNPYHFVPLGSRSGQGSLPVEKFDQRELPVHARHDQWGSGTYSGRIVCRLTTVTPLVIGGKQTGTAPKCVHPFSLPEGQETPAIPPSTIKGLISSLAEAASNSAFRVLEDRYFSYRQGMQEGLSAMGMIVEKNGKLELYPLAQPHLYADGWREPDKFPLEQVLPDRDKADYYEIFPRIQHKVYFGDKSAVRDHRFQETYKTNKSPHSGPFYGLLEEDLNDKIKNKRRVSKPDRWFDLGEETRRYPRPWDEIPEDERSEYVRGVLRVLGVYSSRKEELPTKKHEFFFPFSCSDEQQLEKGETQTFPLTPTAVERFNQLADERTLTCEGDVSPEKLLPFTPHGQSRHDGRQDPDRPAQAYHLKAGDIVFFRASKDGQRVVEVALSSIWRGRVEHRRPQGDDADDLVATRLSDFIAQINPDLLPMGDPRKKNLTAAELLFGFAEKDGKRMLAGRVYPSFGLPAPGQSDLVAKEWVDLQVLNSPKPPSPALYFKPAQGSAPVTKSGLNLQEHRIQGRKAYLHPQSAAGKTQPNHPQWSMHPDNVRRKDYDKLRVRVKPIQAKKTFWFHLDFENLSRFELGLLCYALDPGGNFHHKLGLGKPLGLGTVKIEPQALLLIDRHRRYASDGLDAPRYHHCWTVGEGAAVLPATYQQHTVAASRLPEDSPDTLPALRQEFRALMQSSDPTGSILTAIDTLGDPAKVLHPVHYPQIEERKSDSASFESERYLWFVSNDHRKQNHRQSLGSLQAGKIPSLKKHSHPDRYDDKGRGTY